MYKARHTVTGEVVAVKTVPYDKMDRRAVCLEASLMRALIHPNIIRFSRYHELNATMFLVMELCTGGGKLVNPTLPLPWQPG